MKKMSPQEMLNNIRGKANLNKEDFTKSIAIKLKAGKIKFQLLALNSEHLFKPRTQHLIPTIPHEEDKNEKWLIADCKGQNCPVCTAANMFKQSGITVEEINEEYSPKFPYKSIRSLFTQPEHYLLCAKVLADQADEGQYLPKDAELGSTQLIQFNRTALNNLMSAYEDFLEDNEDNGDAPALFAIFDDEKVAKSLTITCRVSMQPYSCTFTFGKTNDVDLNSVDVEKLKLLEETKDVPNEHYEKCVKRIKNIQNYFSRTSASNNSVEKSADASLNNLSSLDDDLNIDDILSDDDTPF